MTTSTSSIDDPRLRVPLQSMEMAAELLLSRGYTISHRQLTTARTTIAKVVADDAASRARLEAEREVMESRIDHLTTWLLSLRSRGETDALWAAVDAYEAVQSTSAEKMLAALTTFLQAVDKELHEEFWGDLDRCDACGLHMPTDTMTPHFDVLFCVKCDIESRARFEACAHEWEEDSDPNGEAAKYCAQCGWTVPHQHAARLFPFACDGWIEEPAA